MFLNRFPKLFSGFYCEFFPPTCCDWPQNEAPPHRTCRAKNAFAQPCMRDAFQLFQSAAEGGNNSKMGSCHLVSWLCPIQTVPFIYPNFHLNARSSSSASWRDVRLALNALWKERTRFWESRCVFLIFRLSVRQLPILDRKLRNTHCEFLETFLLSYSHPTLVCLCQDNGRSRLTRKKLRALMAMRLTANR